MKNRYILSIDQSTQGTKALLFDRTGAILGRADRPHRQIITPQGWVEHDPLEILDNTLATAREVVEGAGIDAGAVAGIGISNQRESAVVWDRAGGEPLHNIIVWQCARGEAICGELLAKGQGELIQFRTGLRCSPFFSAAKIAWVIREVEGAGEKSRRGELCCGTVDSWLLYRLTGERVFKTDYSNASRTQLFNIRTLEWDSEICGLFGVNPACLAEICDSDSAFGTSDLGGLLPRPVPIHAVMGDSHGALFGQGCHRHGMAKATYGTGSSVMMNIGGDPIFSDSVVTSLAWGLGGRVSYVLEGNINYTGAVISWLKDDLGLIHSAAECAALAKAANPDDTTYLVPAFSGLGAPHWDGEAAGLLCGMTRLTGRREIVRAAEDCIAYQIADIIKVMHRDTGIRLPELRADGGPTRDDYLMQFQSDILGIEVNCSGTEELSGTGVAYAAGMAMGLFGEEVFDAIARRRYKPGMPPEQRRERYGGWQRAVARTLYKTQ